MENLREILSRLLIDQGSERRARQGPVFDRWPEVVGDLLAQKCRPISIRKGVLSVQVADAVWMQELQLQKYQILQRLWVLVGEEQVKDLRWTIRGAYGRAPRRRRPAPPLQRPQPLSEEEAAWVQAVSAQVEDPELQRAVARVLGKYLRSPHKR